MTIKEILHNDPIGNVFYHIFVFIYKYIIYPIFGARTTGWVITKTIFALMIIVLLYMIFDQSANNEVDHELFPLLFISVLVYLFICLPAHIDDED